MSKHQNTHSALSEKSGVTQPNSISSQALANIRHFKKKQPTVEELIQGILEHNIISLSRAITIVESTNPDHFEKANGIVTACLPYSTKSIRIGITGVPGVGKSTFIEAFGKHLTKLGKRVAVLAVDPSSTISSGSILGDKTRMEELVKDKNAYIRPSASGKTLGGVARKTRETITLCEACGFDVIIIETVGVGQSETAVHSMVDFFLLLNIPGAGDELQGIKRGIMEMADTIVINKADGDNKRRANLAKADFHRALHLFPAKKSGWTPTATTCSALTSEGIGDVWNIIDEYITLTKENEYFNENRREQNQYWLIETIEEQLKLHFYNQPDVNKLLADSKDSVLNNVLSPFVAADQLLEKYFMMSSGK